MTSEKSPFQEAWSGLREPIEIDLARILDTEDETPHGHYAAALLIVIACEGLSRLLDHKRDVFVDDLVMPHNKTTRAMAEDLWEGLRDGLAHRYETKFIKVDGKEEIELVVSWRKFAHLSRREHPRLGIFLNLHTMHEDLRRIFAHYDAQFSAAAGRKLPSNWLAKRITTARPDPGGGWRSFLKEAAR